MQVSRPWRPNATSTFALWLVMLASAFAYRRDIATLPRRSLAFSITLSLVGGLLGGRCCS